MKRIFLFLLTNFAVMFVLMAVTSLLGVDRYLTANSLNYQMLAVFSLIVGFTGSIISLLMSKASAKMTMGLHMITQPQTQDEAWLLETVRRLATEAKIGMPEVAIYEGEANAFATGAFKNSALVAVSTGLLQSMNKDEVTAVMAHEISHVANGDMVTLTLVQGVMNTFVVFFSRVIGYMVDASMRRDSDENSGPGMGYMLTSFVLNIVLGFLGSMVVAWFSRHREFRADAGSAKLMGQPSSMISALRSLAGDRSPDLPDGMAAMGITGSKIGSLFASHPPLEVRIAALQKSAIAS